MAISLGIYPIFRETHLPTPIYLIKVTAFPAASSTPHRRPAPNVPRQPAPPRRRGALPCGTRGALPPPRRVPRGNAMAQSVATAGYWGDFRGNLEETQGFYSEN